MSVPDGLLVLLQDAPKHGYQLATEFAERTSGQWRLNTGQVYSTLDRLVRDGFIEADGTDPADDRRRLYRLADSGWDRSRRWLSDAPETPAGRDDLVLRVLLVAAVDPATALVVVDAQRRQLVARLQRMRREQRSDARDLLHDLASEAALTRVEGDLRWLDLCEERLRSQRKDLP